MLFCWRKSTRILSYILCRWPQSWTLGCWSLIYHFIWMSGDCRLFALYPRSIWHIFRMKKWWKVAIICYKRTYHACVLFIFQTGSGIQTFGVAVDWIQWFIDESKWATCFPPMTLIWKCVVSESDLRHFVSFMAICSSF